MLRRCAYFLAALTVALYLTRAGATQSAEKIKKVLLIGIDGCRPDALQRAQAPQIGALADQGAVSYTAQNLPLRLTDVETSSGPSWSTMLSGVFPAPMNRPPRSSFDGRIRAGNREPVPMFPLQDGSCLLGNAAPLPLYLHLRPLASPGGMLQNVGLPATPSAVEFRSR